MAEISLHNITKSYHDTNVIHDLNLSINDGEFIVFVGPSGCGKSTTLRMIAGLEDISSGELYINGQLMNDVLPAKRGLSMVFQSYALYPHMKVYDNLAFGLKISKTPKDEIDKRVQEAARILQLTDYLHRYPKALSGGQRQRVAIGRAIVRNPVAFLFDEPLSNLDAALRQQTRVEIAQLHKKLGAMMLYVTHDQIEAMTLADRIVILNHGRIEQIGAPQDLYSKPNNLFVAGFIGSNKMNFIATSDKIVQIANMPDSTHHVGMRPEHLSLCAKNDALFEAKFHLSEHMGEYLLGHSTLANGQDILIKLDHDKNLHSGETLYINCAHEYRYFFDKDDKII